MSTDTVKVDDLTIAYMTKGACNNLNRLTKAVSINGEGELEYLSHVIDLATDVEREFKNRTTFGDYCGCFVYDVAEPIGQWITEQTVLNDVMPSKCAVAEKAAELITQHIDN